MNNQQFFIAVRNMRAAQKNYFKTRTPEALQESKRLEGEVDRAIANANQKSLF